LGEIKPKGINQNRLWSPMHEDREP